MTTKKPIIKWDVGILGWLILFGSILLISFIPVQQKKYRVDLTIDEANALLYCIDKSTAEHTVVKNVSELIAKQINAQLEAEKPKADTTKKKQ